MLLLKRCQQGLIADNSCSIESVKHTTNSNLQVRHRKSMKTKVLPHRVIIHPDFDALYYSYYVEGIRQAWPSARLCYKNFSCPGNRTLMRMIIQAGQAFKVALCAMDSPEIDIAVLEWADLYGKVNLRYEDYMNAGSKLCALGPSFAVRSWGILRGLLLTAQSFIWQPTNANEWIEHAKQVYRQWRYRLPLNRYVPSDEKHNYVFFTGSLWKKEPHTNEARANFVRACRRIAKIQFEGGLAPRKLNDVPGFDDVSSGKRYNLEEYLTKLARSTVAFNTPGVLSCLGWKLPEFMALGKAIISLPLERLMPAPLEHGVHMHFIKTGRIEEIQEAVELLIYDEKYRKKLAYNARSYFDRWLSPEAVMARLLHKLTGARKQ